MNILSLFDGMACGMLAFQKAGIKVDNYYAYEIDKYAIQTATHNFLQIQECGDVFNADFAKYSNIDYLIGGSPCFTKGHLVLTDKGYKDISEIEIGDMVLTHKNRYKPVIRLYKHNAETVKLKVVGYPEFTVTPNHPFYTIKKSKCSEKEYFATGSWRKFSSNPEWSSVDSLQKNSFCGRHCFNTEVCDMNITDEELWLIGRYIADGTLYRSKRSDSNGFRHQIIISCGEKKVNEFKQHIKSLKFSCYPHSQGVYRCEFSSKRLYDLIYNLGCGRGAYNKNIPVTIMNLPKDRAKIFLDGYISGDGCYVKSTDSYTLSTVSPKLAFGLQRLIAFVYGTNAGVCISDNNRLHKINGRDIKANYPLYTIVFKKDMRKQSVYHIQDDIIWTPFKKMIKTNNIETVYNIEVEEDHSYTINNCIVKNCTYWSIAQSPDKRETTASGIGWELFSQYVRALHEAKPKLFIYENNKSMSKAIYKSISETFGFEPICINSALVSAQNRQRLYWVGKRNADGTYSKVDVQQPEDRGILLRDILDGADLTNCDKAYCLTSSYDGACAWNTIERHQRSMVAEPVGTTKDGKAYCLSAGYSNGSGEKIGNYAAHTLKKGCKSMVAEPVNVTADGKAQCLRATCYKDGVRNIAGNDIDKKTGVAEPVCIASRGRYSDTDSRSSKTDAPTYQHYEARTDGKTNAVTTVSKDNLIGEPVRCFTLPREDGAQTQSKQYRVYETSGKSTTLCAEGGGMGAKTGLYAIPVEFNGEIPVKAISAADGKTYTVYEVKGGNITIKSKTYPIKLIDGYYIIRKLTVSECKRLQTVPEWYEFPVSDTQAYKMLGNGWTVDVIVHLIEATKAGKTVEKIEQLSLF